jgi:hypothetical protein
LSQVLDRGAQAVDRGIARCASQVLFRGTQAVARGAAALSQQEKNNSADVQPNGVNITDGICLVARYSSRRRICDEFELLTVAPRRR